MAPIVRDQKTRQGPIGRPVLMVLIGAFVLIAVYLVSMMLWAGSTSPDSASQDASRTAVTGSPSGSANRTDRTPTANPAYPLRDNETTGSTRQSGPPGGSLDQSQKR
jgi:hypothetical protein